MNANTEPAETGRPWGKVCCFGCLFFLVAAAIGIVVFFRVVNGPGSEQISALPPTYPKDLPLTRLESAKSIRYLSGGQRSKTVGLITRTVALIGAGFSSSTNVEKGISNAVQLAAGSERVIVEWRDLNASRDEILRYYSELFRRAGMKDEATADESGTPFVAVARRDDAAIQMYIEDQPDVPNIEKLLITIDYVPKP